ncbi:hypothetical protein PEBR_15780 [Penicillium brasilianum]|uniref:NACHT-NTPase and P-loop NTPases N-terminal domain-containing protein n=1 Tax=Penicillium brasilianum TaxID=104259 RepID=A0A1S9RRG6_PENBI|nr:hypothetical protein PEBR_15780 [Penicillium brasilianum]
MAEALSVVGAVSSVIQLVEFTTKVFGRVNQYIRRVDEAPETLRGIGIHLPLFIDALQRIQFHIDFGHFNPQTSSALNIMINECYSQMIALDDLMTKLTPEQGDSRLTKTRKAILSLKDESTLERIFSKVSGYIKMLLLYQNSVTATHTMINTKLVLKQLENASFSETTMRIDCVAATGDSRSLSIDNSAPRLASKSLANYFRQNKERRITYFMGLARFGFYWAFQADLDLSWGNYGFSIIPSLHFQRLVKNTSPGFQLVYKCCLYQLDIHTACQELFNLFQRGAISPWDTFPDGRTWLERLLTNFGLRNSIISEFITTLCKCGALTRNKTPLLSLVAGLKDRGLHLKTLKELLASGYDCSLDTTFTDLFGSHRQFRKGDKFAPCFFDQDDGEYEPFLLKFLVECSKNAFGVWGQTPLMDSVLSGSKTEISKLLQHPECLKAKNALGQTVFHLAVLRPDVLSLLIKAYSDFGVPEFNAPDSSGASPLHYAAAYGCTTSVISLLKAGADPLEDGHLTFIITALFWNHWDVAAEALAFLRATPRTSDAFIQNELRYLMTELLDGSDRIGLSPIFRGRSSEILEKMFSLGVDKHMLSGHGKTLLHYAPDSEWIDHLFDSGFQHIDHSDSKGDTALMAFIPDRSDRVWNILARGCNINHRNNRSETALHKACAIGWFYCIRSSIYQDEVTVDPAVLATISRDLAVIAELLHQGADTWILDDCRCPCAPDGCSAFLRMLRSCGYHQDGYIWILECLLMLNEIQGQTVAEKVLFEINRLREFESADMTHVCCRRRLTAHGLTAHEPMDDAEVDEIVDEENEFVTNLEETMRNTSFNPDKEFLEEGWLGLIGEFRTLSISSKPRRFWVSWNPTTVNGEQVLFKSDSLFNSSISDRANIWIEEEEDRFWYSEGFTVPESSIYSSWVEWFFKNSGKYDYPLPVDNNWYEKRKYWATRQAEVLEGLS